MTGKAALRADQMAPINAVFTPSSEATYSLRMLVL